MIDEKEALVVRKIYRYFLDGKTPGGIAQSLMDEGVPTPGGKTKWIYSTITSILQNEKYKGDGLLKDSAHSATETAAGLIASRPKWEAFSLENNQFN